MGWREGISSRPDVCHGQACTKGTRVPASVVVDNVAAGDSPERIVQSYPGLTVQDVVAAIKYAAEVTRSERVMIVRPGA